MSDTQRSAKLSFVLIVLLKGVIYREQMPIVWDDLLTLRAAVEDYMRQIALELHVNEAEGFAYLKQMPIEDEQEALPRLIQRRALSYPVSLLCALLRKQLIEADTSGDHMRLVMTQDQMFDMMKVYFVEGSNEVLTRDKIESYIHKIQEFGFLKMLKSAPPAYEVRRIIKAVVDADWLSLLQDKLQGYAHDTKP